MNNHIAELFIALTVDMNCELSDCEECKQLYSQLGFEECQSCFYEKVDIQELRDFISKGVQILKEYNNVPLTEEEFLKMWLE